MTIDQMKARIDRDLWAASTKYVEDQLEVMKRFGSVPVLTPARYYKLVYDCAWYPQRLRNMVRSGAVREE